MTKQPSGVPVCWCILHEDQTGGVTGLYVAAGLQSHCDHSNMEGLLQ